MWPLAAMFAVNFVSGILKSDEQNQQIAAQNNAIAAQTKAATLEAGQTASALNVQSGALASQATGQIAEATRLADIQAGQQAAAAGAAGIRGASVDAVQNDIQLNLDRTQQATLDDLAIRQFNTRQQAIQAYRSVYLNARQPTSGISPNQAVGGALLNAGLQTGGAYAAQYFQFGSSGSTGGAFSSSYGSSTSTFTG